MADATHLLLAPGRLLGVHGLATKAVHHLLYSSERLNTRATHIQYCPGQPRKGATEPLAANPRKKSLRQMARFHFSPLIYIRGPHLRSPRASGLPRPSLDRKSVV